MTWKAGRSGNPKGGIPPDTIAWYLQALRSYPHYSRKKMAKHIPWSRMNRQDKLEIFALLRGKHAKFIR